MISAAGVLWEMAREALQSMGYEPELEFVPWNRALRMVEAGQRDAILGIGYTPERSEQYFFPAEHLLLSETVVFTLQDQALNFTGVESLKGLQVGLQAGYAYSTEVRKTMPLSVIEQFSRELAAYKQVRGIAANHSQFPQ